VWNPNTALFARYGIPSDDYAWFLRGQDPVSYSWGRDAEKPVNERPILQCITLFMDKFRRGALCVSRP